MKRAKVVQINEFKPVEDRAAIIDEYGRLDARLRETEPLRKRREALRDKILSWYESADAADRCTAEGTAFSLEISARENRRSIVSWAAVKARLGFARLMKVCSVSIEKLQAELPAAEFEALVKTERLGPRRITVTAIATEVRAA